MSTANAQMFSAVNTVPRRVHERLHIHIVGVILVTRVCTKLDGLTKVNSKVPRKSILRPIYQLIGRVQIHNFYHA